MASPIVWDATFPDTLALSYHCYVTSSAGAVAALAEERKSAKYSTLGPYIYLVFFSFFVT